MSDPARAKLFLPYFAIPLCLVLTLGFLLLRASRESVEAVRWVRHTYEVSELIEQTFSDIVNAETGQRGFLLTGDESYLNPYNAAVEIIPDELQTLGTLTKDNSRQQTNVAVLRKLVDRRFSQLKQNIQIRKTNGFEGALPLVTSGEGKKTMDEIRRTVGGMKAQEMGLLHIRNRQLENISTMRQLLSAAIVIIGIAFVALIVMLLGRLQRLQSLVEVCTWTGKIQFDGRWMTFEEFVKARAGAASGGSPSKETLDLWQKEVDALKSKKEP